ncbi:hypothetical protein MHTCC0001_30170 [Flavobacteriaceae bacterium MHTCC 0001]
MKAVNLPEIKKELNMLSNNELQQLCLRLARFKKENKELLTYLLFEAQSESGYIKTVEHFIDEEFNLINTSNFYYIKKSVRKILRNVKKFIRYSQQKETEVELLLYFCKKLKYFEPSITHSVQLQNMYHRQLDLAKKTVAKLHEDLQYDYNLILQTFQD